MTIRGLGRAMPVHIMMVRLAGIQVTRLGPVDPADDEPMLATMRGGRAELRCWCAVDFGADLAAWRSYLLSPAGADKGYTHPYSFATVDKLVVAAIADPRRTRLAALLEDEP